MSDYGLPITLNIGYADAIERTRAALADQGFGILTEIDVAATLKAKLGADVAPYLILGACNPALAHRAITTEASIGLLLPCNVVVRALDVEHTLVEALDPQIMVRVTGDPRLGRIAEEAKAKLTAALQALTDREVAPA